VEEGRDSGFIPVEIYPEILGGMEKNVYFCT
jgi:hypothetical protein